MRSNVDIYPEITPHSPYDGKARKILVKTAATSENKINFSQITQTKLIRRGKSRANLINQIRIKIKS